MQRPAVTEHRLLTLAFLSLSYVAVPAFAKADPCTDEFLSSDPGTLRVDCNPTLQSTDVVRRPLLFEGDAADHVFIDCHGATIDAPNARYAIEIRSKVAHYTSSAGEKLYYNDRNQVTTNSADHPIPLKRFNGYYERERPERITIQNCNVKGTVRIWGLGTNGQGGFMWTSSHDPSLPDHTERARDAAPTGITFDNVQFMARPSSGNMFYISPGTTGVTIMNSRFIRDPDDGSGSAPAANLYLDAESAYNVIRNNRFLTGTDGRELVAVDGSSHNDFIDNYFSGLSNGGIYLYRNCGEDGVTRVATPSYNNIVNNIFYYKNYSGYSPAIWIGSRNTVTFNHYCGKDDGIPYGSGSSNWDFATHNIVAQNQIYARSTSDMIQVGLPADYAFFQESKYNYSKSSNSPNYIMENTTVSEAVDRPAGCYLGRDYYQDLFIQDGTPAAVMLPGPVDSPECERVECRDGSIAFLEQSCSPVAVDFECNRSQYNGGCSGEATCPLQFIGPFPFPTFPIGLTGTCNLETNGAFSSADMADSRINYLRVQTPSDNVSDGVCKVGSTQLSSGMTLMKDTWTLGATYSCRERDSNGGDCRIRGTLYCL